MSMKRTTQLHFEALTSPITYGSNSVLKTRKVESKAGISETLQPTAEETSDILDSIEPQSQPIQVLSPHLSAGSFETKYKKCYSLQVGERKLEVVSKRDISPNGDFVGGLLREISGERASIHVHRIWRIQHSSFVKPVETFKTNGDFLVVFEFMPLSLVEIATVRDLSQSDLATIFKQIIDGLFYLGEQGMGHKALTCSNVLVDYNGNVKIWGQEQCTFKSAGNLCNSLYYLTLEFMMGFKQTDQTQEPQLPQAAHWTGTPLLVDFFEVAKSMKSEGPVDLNQDKAGLRRLSQHQFIQCHTHPSSLTIPFTRIIGLIAWLVK